MAARKDNKGRALRKGEFQRASDGKYVYGYVDPNGVRRYIYSKDLKTLREREKELVKDQLDGLDVYVAGSADLNFVFDRYISTKSELRSSTYTNYTYMYDHFVRDGFGKKKIGDIKYSDVLQFYQHLLKDKGIQINTLDTIHTVLHPTFQLAVRDEIIRINPSDGVMAELKKKTGKNKGVRHALTLEQQRAFMNYMAQSPVFVGWYNFFTVLLGTGCRIGEVVLIPHFSCHHLRHTFCTRFCENETNVKVIQAIMGHASIETTMDIYAEVTDMTKKEAIDNLSANLDVF